MITIFISFYLRLVISNECPVFFGIVSTKNTISREGQIYTSTTLQRLLGSLIGEYLIVRMWGFLFIPLNYAFKETHYA
jgi:SAM-dependent MidA family methyltransferase